MTIDEEIIEGIFIEESKNRFLCYVLIDREICECYVPSASKLKNYLNMKNKKVILTINKKTNLRTKYSIFAVKYYNKFIILNLSIVNKMVEEYLKKKYSIANIEREKYFEGYKSDFLISEETNVIIEAKGIIAARKSVDFPTVHCQRAIYQLEKIEKLLRNGHEVQYFLISLSPIVQTIKINNDIRFKQYTDLLLKCINQGMRLSSFNIFFEKNEIEIGKEITLLSR